jgi:3-methyl-2-oxobutanoate hydroxymethyltransferase
MIVFEMMPAALGKSITESLTRMATIGIGAGPACSGQVLVLYDMLGVFPGKRPRFAKNFMPGAESIEAAVRAYVTDVKSGAFPAPEHCY